MTGIKLAAVVVATAGMAMSAWAQDTAPAKTEPVTKPQPVNPELLTKVNPNQPQVPSSGGKIVFTNQLHDFGVISDDRKVETEFTFTNSGTGPLEITKTAGSCGCTVPALSKTTYAPGESGTIKVQFDPNHKRGAQTTTVTVSTNDDSARSVVLTLKSDVRPMVMADPQVLSLGEVRRGEARKMTVMVTSRKADLTIMGATPTIATISTNVLPGVEAQVNGETVWKYPVEVAVSPSAPVGPVNGSVAIRTNEVGRVINFTVQGEILGDVAVNPQRVQLQAITPGQALSSIVTLKSRNGKPFKVSKVEELPANAAMGAIFTTLDVKEIPQKSGDPTTVPSFMITLGGVAPSLGGSVSGYLVVHTDLPDEKEIKIPYYGFVRQTPKPVPVETKPAEVAPVAPTQPK
ncbi:MAG: hypothetical protein HBSAPP03_03800 [Phycisphaerae bacterium]|nr:MAG: hypothetical protein HBSAPP03_03800 [Phycisphaerae bacterium]